MIFTKLKLTIRSSYILEQTCWCIFKFCTVWFDSNSRGNSKSNLNIALEKLRKKKKRILFSLPLSLGI